MTARSDHPHAGGEYSTNLLYSLGESGPSPRGWGIRDGEIPRNGQTRTIPTRVGNTRSAASLSTCCADHPHAGGEYPVFARKSVITSGPSPRGWGIRLHPHREVRQQRTIPTRVGNTLFLLASL